MYNCKIFINDNIVYDKTLKSMKLIAQDLGVPYSRIADSNTRPHPKKKKLFKFDPVFKITKIKKDLPNDTENISNKDIIDAEKSKEV
tara:strand:+ start:1539 stop:1799 length:261 start_codon:yes stop_codon:yes gene_type:complete